MTSSLLGNGDSDSSCLTSSTTCTSLLFSEESLVVSDDSFLEEVKKVCVPLVRVYSVQRQSLGKMVAKEAIQKKVMTALEMRLEQRQSDLRRVEMARVERQLQVPREMSQTATSEKEMACRVVEMWGCEG